MVRQAGNMLVAVSSMSDLQTFSTRQFLCMIDVSTAAQPQNCCVNVAWCRHWLCMFWVLIIPAVPNQLPKTEAKVWGAICFQQSTWAAWLYGVLNQAQKSWTDFYPVKSPDRGPSSLQLPQQQLASLALVSFCWLANIVCSKPHDGSGTWDVSVPRYLK